MDVPRLYRIARALGGAASRREALAALLGLAAAGPARRAAGKRKCRRDSPTGQCCRKRDGAIACTCDNGGTVCGADCCPVGQRCQGGRCVDMPEPPVCIAFGQPCKGVGRRCCAGLACGSGQGGLEDIACYKPAGGPCAATAECTYDSTCKQGTCEANPHPGPVEKCAGSIEVTDDPVANGNALRALAEDPSGPATITLCAGTYRAAREILVTRDLAIEAAADAGGEVILDGGWSGNDATDGHQVITVTDADVRLTGITVQHGNIENGFGGCLSATSTGPATGLTLSRVRVTSCKGVVGGGISASGPPNTVAVQLSVHDSEISGNTASVHGGGLFTSYAAVTLDGATRITGNSSAGSSAGGIYALLGSVHLGGTVRVTGNSAATIAAGIFSNDATVTCSGTPRICDNPLNSSSSGCLANLPTECEPVCVDGACP